MEKEQFWNFTEGAFPSIEVDIDLLKTLNTKDKVRYIMRLLFQEKDFGNRLNMLTWLTSNVSKLSKTFVKNPEFHEYMKLLENGTRLVGVAAAVGNIVKAKQNYKNYKNNEIAKLMGLPNGNYVGSTKLSATVTMLEYFLEMDDYHKNKYSIKLEHISKNKQNEGTNAKEGDDNKFSAEKLIVVGSLEKDENKFGLICNYNTAMSGGGTDVTDVQVFYPTTGSSIVDEDLRDKLEDIIMELFIEKVDTRNNYIVINGSELVITEKKQISENIRNINIDKIYKSMNKTLSEKKRRGIVLVGEPGTGKTISVHKLINMFPKNVVFWVKPDSIASTYAIRRTFKLFEMFGSSIMIFDDLDSAPLTSKNEVTNEFLSKLDGTSDLTGFIIATVNDPSKLHPALINRPERFDEAIEVKTPQSFVEIYEILESKSIENGYFYKSSKKNYDEDTFKGYIKVKLSDESNEEVVALYKKIQEYKLTQVQVAGLINYCHQYHEEVSIKSLNESLESAINSMNCANLVAKKGRLTVSDGISDDAKAALSSGVNGRGMI